MALIDKTYSFYCDDLNFNKYGILYKKAQNILKFKNNISNIIMSDYKKYMNLSKFDWITEFRTEIEYCNNQDISHAISDVYVAYDNKRKAYNKLTKIKIQKEIKKTYYKKDGKKFKKGDIKSFNIVHKSTIFTMVVSYLTRYYSENLIDYLKNNKSEDKNIQEFRDVVLNYIDKYGNKLITLVLNKQTRLHNKIFKHGIEFTKLTFTSCTEQKQNIINKNPRTASKYNAYITLSGQKTEDGKIHIPVKHSRKHHGCLKHYFKKPNKKGQINVSYTIIFELNGNIRISLTRKKSDYVVIGKTNYYGVDVNVKHNMFSDKQGNTIDYDRKLLNEYLEFIKKCDIKLSKKKQLKEEPKLSNRDKRTMNKWMVRIEDMLKRKSNLLVKQAIDLNKDHIGLEDIRCMGKSYVRSEDLMGFKYSRLMKLLNLGSLKHIIRSIGNKRGLQITYLHPHYSSKGCKCGCIDDRNRIIQEEFKCVGCGFTCNADTHSADMLEDRLSIDVLRESLLTFKDGLYTPKKLNKSTIKKILTECYDGYAEKSVIDE